MDAKEERELWRLLDAAPIRWNAPTAFLAWSGDYLQIAQALRNEYDRQAALRDAGGLLPPTSNLLVLALHCDETHRLARAREAAPAGRTPRPGSDGC
jgi:hypothetical protein